MKLGIREKLLAGFAAVLVLLAIVAILSIQRLDQVAGRTDALYRENALGIKYSLEVNAAMIASAREEKRALLTDVPAERSKLVAESRQELAVAKKALTDYKTTIASAENEEQWSAVTQKVEAVAANREQVLALIDKGDIAAAKEKAVAMTASIGEMNAAVGAAADFNAELALTSKDAAADAASSTRTLLVGLTIAAVVIGLGIGFWLSRSMANAAKMVLQRLQSIESKDVADLQKAIMAVESGDLTVDVQPVTPRIEKYSNDEVGQTAAAINSTLDKLVATIGSYNAMRKGLQEIVRNVQANAGSIMGAADQLRESSDQMAAATGQIASAINEVTRSAVSLSSLSQESAREVEKVAAGSQEVAAAASSNSSSATQAKGEATDMSERITLVATASEEVVKAADESRTAALQGQQAVGQAVSSMEAIATAVQRASQTVDQLGEYGKQIGDIVKVIDDIASQTNLLALNAAIEAARAGEQGRGFAVVADNVRSLAERSSESTKEIADLIAKVQAGTREAVEAMGVGVKDVQSGREITKEAGTALESIIASVQGAAAQMRKIATDVQGLSSGAQRIVGSAENALKTADQAAQGAGEMARGTSKVTDAIMQVSATSGQTSASAEEVSASTEELSAQSEELAATAGQLRELSQALGKAVARFRLEGATG